MTNHKMDQQQNYCHVAYCSRHPLPPSRNLWKKTSWWLDRCYCRLRWIDWALQIPIVFGGKVLQSDCEYSYENVLPTYLNNTEKVLQTILQQLQYYINSRCADSRAILCNIFSARSITPSYAAWFQIIRSVFLSEKKQSKTHYSATYMKNVISIIRLCITV